MSAERLRPSRPRARPTVLAIAGSDSGGGAGLQADLKTFAAHGVHGVCAVTAVTAQNTRAVIAVEPVPAPMVAAQIRAVFDDFDIRAVKTGMLATAAIVEAVCEALEAYPGPPLVVDPVIAATSGRRLLDEDAVAIVRGRLLKRARVVTPNRFEAEVLADQPIASPDDARRAAGRIRTRGRRPSSSPAATSTPPSRSTCSTTGARSSSCAAPGSTAGRPTGPDARSRPPSRPDSPPACRCRTPRPTRNATSRRPFATPPPLGHGPGPLHHFWRNERQ